MRREYNGCHFPLEKGIAVSVGVFVGSQHRAQLNSNSLSLNEVPTSMWSVEIEAQDSSKSSRQRFRPARSPPFSKLVDMVRRDIENYPRGAGSIGNEDRSDQVKTGEIESNCCRWGKVAKGGRHQRSTLFVHKIGGCLLMEWTRLQRMKAAITKSGGGGVAFVGRRSGQQQLGPH